MKTLLFRRSVWNPGYNTTVRIGEEFSGQLKLGEIVGLSDAMTPHTIEKKGKVLRVREMMFGDIQNKDLVFHHEKDCRNKTGLELYLLEDFLEDGQAPGMLGPSRLMTVIDFKIVD